MAFDLSVLNPEQRAAASAPDGVQLVIAGAGTGKTRALVYRVAWLIERGVDPREIALLTFTRRAAGEMLERVSAMVGAGANQVRGGTFHAFANRSLRRHARRLGYTPSFTVLDRDDARGLVQIARTSLDLRRRGRRFPAAGAIQSMLSKAVNTSSPLAEVVEVGWPQFVEDVEDIARVGAAYAARKQRQDLVDYDDLLVLLARLLSEHPAARRDLSSACRYVLVDEYQDTNRLQALIACLLASHHGNLVVVGDEAQSIYRFRGAVVENLLDFPSIFPDCQRVTLVRNYRSSQAVLDLANGVLAGATRGFEKRLVAHSAEGPRPARVRPRDGEAEADFIARRALALREQGVALREIAVLFRAGFHSASLELALARANLPFRKFGGVRFTDAAHVKDALALVRLAANPLDELAWNRVLQWLDGVGPKTAGRIFAAVEADPGHALDPAAFGPRLDPELTAIQAFREAGAGLLGDPAALVALALRYYRPLLTGLYDDAARRRGDLDALEALSARYRSVEGLLTDFALDPPTSAAVEADDDEDEWLTLSTVHSAKGLEWDTVFVLRLVDGGFPIGRALDDPDALEEERRLLYVAITRAKRRLFLLQPMFLARAWGRAFGPGCRLLDAVEGFERLVEEVDPDADPDAPPPSGAVEAEARVLRLLDYFNR